MIPAVEYINANRVRTLAMRAMHETMRDIDVFVTPSYGGNVLVLTNLTGHPAVCLPNGFTEVGTPVSVSFVGRLWGEAAVLRVSIPRRYFGLFECVLGTSANGSLVAGVETGGAFLHLYLVGGDAAPDAGDDPRGDVCIGLPADLISVFRSAPLYFVFCGTIALVNLLFTLGIGRRL